MTTEQEKREAADEVIARAILDGLEPAGAFNTLQDVINAVRLLEGTHRDEWQPGPKTLAALAETGTPMPDTRPVKPGSLVIDGLQLG